MVFLVFVNFCIRFPFLSLDSWTRSDVASSGPSGQAPPVNFEKYHFLERKKTNLLAKILNFLCLQHSRRIF